MLKLLPIHQESLINTPSINTEEWTFLMLFAIELESIKYTGVNLMKGVSFSTKRNHKTLPRKIKGDNKDKA